MAASDSDPGAAAAQEEAEENPGVDASSVLSACKVILQRAVCDSKASCHELFTADFLQNSRAARFYFSGQTPEKQN